MNEIREWIQEMDVEEKRQMIGAGISWSGLLFIAFMLSVVFG